MGASPGFGATTPSTPQGSHKSSASHRGFHPRLFKSGWMITVGGTRPRRPGPARRTASLFPPAGKALGVARGHAEFQQHPSAGYRRRPPGPRSPRRRVVSQRVVSESQRDSVPKPGVARHELPWVIVRKSFPTATRLWPFPLRSWHATFATTPLGLPNSPDDFPGQLVPRNPGLEATTPLGLFAPGRI
jgi:hypothetical protein